MGATGGANDTSAEVYAIGLLQKTGPAETHMSSRMHLQLLS